MNDNSSIAAAIVVGSVIIFAGIIFAALFIEQGLYNGLSRQAQAIYDGLRLVEQGLPR
jgi:hypothetical protein